MDKGKGEGSKNPNLFPILQRYARIQSNYQGLVNKIVFWKDIPVNGRL
jgi:hypothetical protein